MRSTSYQSSNIASLQIMAWLTESYVVHQIFACVAWFLLKAQVALQRSFAAPEECPSQGFLPDEELGSSPIYQLITFLFCRWAKFFHAYEMVGVENLPPKGEGVLLVSMHTTHNTDIFTAATMLHDQSGRAPRGLIHRRVYQCHPWIKHVGMVPGNRSTAVEFLRQGFAAACLPGGGEEAMEGHENAYTLGKRWEDRRGYAHVAKEASVKICPFFTQNCEEMRFNPFFWIGNRLRIGQAYNTLVMVPAVGAIVKILAMTVWFVLSWTAAIPVPVKVTTFIGEPIETQNLSADEIAAATHEALQKLIDEKQPHGHSYGPGLKERFAAQNKLE